MDITTAIIAPMVMVITADVADITVDTVTDTTVVAAKFRLKVY